jgi:hypothetical protein
VKPAQAILGGTLLVGTLDILDAIVFFGIRNGTTPMRIFHSIASGWLGRGAYQGGVPAAALGLATHYVIAFGIVTTYFLASRKLEMLVRRPILWGAIYGIAAYFVMNLVVIPLSAIGGPPRVVFSAPFVNGILIHVLGIGIPSAFFAAAARTRSPRPASLRPI